jgi:hypothetical protein
MVTGERVTAFRCIASAVRQQLRQVAVARPIGGEQHEPHIVDERDLAADDELQARILRREVRADDTRERAFVGDGERRIAQRVCALDQFLRMRCAAQEGKIRPAVQLGVGGEHGGGHKTV